MTRTWKTAAGIALAGWLLAACSSGGSPQSRGTPDPTPTRVASSTPAQEDAEDDRSDAEPTAPYDDSLNFAVTTFDGGRFELADHAGVPVVLNFWESW